MDYQRWTSDQNPYKPDENNALANDAFVEGCTIAIPFGALGWAASFGIISAVSKLNAKFNKDG